jgi:hypothetical protein
MRKRLCFEIPRAGGRFLETVTEEFLKLKRDGELGNSAFLRIFSLRRWWKLNQCVTKKFPW